MSIWAKIAKYDIITNGKRLYIVKNTGSYKRTGGIGDILSGLISCYCGMVNKRKSLTQTQLTSEDLFFKYDVCRILYWCPRWGILLMDDGLSPWGRRGGQEHVMSLCLAVSDELLSPHRGRVLHML